MFKCEIVISDFKLHFLIQIIPYRFVTLDRRPLDRIFRPLRRRVKSEVTFAWSKRKIMEVK